MPTKTVNKPKMNKKRRGPKATAPQSLELAGKAFVILEAEEYDRLRYLAGELTDQDLGDIAESDRRESEPSVPLERVRQRLGL